MDDIESIIKLPREELVKKLLFFSSSEIKKVLMRFEPEKRIIIIREIQKQREKEQKEAESLVNESIEEIKQDEKNKEDNKQIEPLPAKYSVFSQEGGLEEQIKRTEPEKYPDEHHNINYNIGDSSQSGGLLYAASLYDELSLISQNPQSNGYESLSRAAEIYDKIKDIGKYESQSQNVKNIAEGSRRIMEELFGEYKAKQDYMP